MLFKREGDVVGECRNDGMEGEHGAPRKWISVRLVIRGVVRWRGRDDGVWLCGGRLNLGQDDTSHPRRRQ